MTCPHCGSFTETEFDKAAIAQHKETGDNLQRQIWQLNEAIQAQESLIMNSDEWGIQKHARKELERLQVEKTPLQWQLIAHINKLASVVDCDACGEAIYPDEIDD